MKEIKLYSFNELSKEAQMKAVAEHRTTINQQAAIYVDEIYTDYIDEIADKLGVAVCLHINGTTDTIGYTVPDKEWRDVCNWGLPQIIGFAKNLAELAVKYPELRKFFNQNIANGKSVTPIELVPFINNIINHLVNEANNWLLRIKFDDEFARATLAGETEQGYTEPDMLLMDCYYDCYAADGTFVDM